MTGPGGTNWLYLTVAVVGALFGLMLSRFAFPAVFGSGTLSFALAFALVVVGLVLLIRAFRRSGASR